MLGKDYMLAIIIVNYDGLVVTPQPSSYATLQGEETMGGLGHAMLTLPVLSTLEMGIFCTRSLYNIWNDETLAQDSDLPPGWRTIQDSSGTYYWHVPTGTTQWQHPSISTDEDKSPQHINTSRKLCIDGRRESRGRNFDSRVVSKNDGGSLKCHEDYLSTNADPDSKCFPVRSLGWVEIPEEDLTPGKSSIAINNCIQQLSQSRCEGREATGAWGEGQDMVMVLRKDSLSLVNPLDHRLIHCQPIISIRVWGVGCNNGRDFAFVASDKDTCMLKCHVFHCNVPAKAIATALHEVMAVKAKTQPCMARSITMQSISPEDLPTQVDFMDAVMQAEQKFHVDYIGHLPVSRAMGMEVLNHAIESIVATTERNEWEPISLHVSDTVLSLWREEDEEEPFWECQVRFLSFLGVGYDSHTFAVIVDTGAQQFECWVFWCEPNAGTVSEAVQAACMVQYQKCLVAQTPPLRKMWRPTPKVKRANSVDSSSFLSHSSGLSHPKTGPSSVRKGMLAFFETLRNKQSPVPAP